MWKPDLKASLRTLRAAIQSGDFEFQDEHAACLYTAPCVIGYLMPPTLRLKLANRDAQGHPITADTQGQMTMDELNITSVAQRCPDLVTLDVETVKVFQQLQSINDSDRPVEDKVRLALNIIDQHIPSEGE